jgi:hypothetical protein
LLDCNFLKDAECNGKQFVLQNNHRLHLQAFFLPMSLSIANGLQPQNTYAKENPKKKTIEKLSYL